MKLVSVLAAILLAGVGFCSAQAQTPITSQNILTPTVGAWTGSVAGQNGGFSGGGNGPAFNATTNTLIFGYTTKTATQNIAAEAFAIQHALDLSNAGIKINGYNYSWKINNSGEQSGTLSGQVQMMRGNTALETYNYNYNATTIGFEQKTGTEIFTNPQSLLAGDSMRLSFTGKDNRFWAGYYGPQVREPSLTLNYTTDPCMGNPLYSPSCPNYNQVLTSQTIYAQTYAINQALNLSGAGVQINGFEYGYNYYVGGDYCHFGFIICLDYRPSSMEVNVGVTSSSGTSLYSAKHTHESNTSGSPSYSYVFPQQRLLSSMGNFTLSTQEVGTTALYSSWSRWQYTPDPCVVNPLSSSTCDGYAAAYQVQQCTANPLYNSACPGYAQAMFTQQCSANALSDPSCPGYASAYLTYQCSINPLYSTTCAGYETAYFDQQCSINPLYNTRCSGYATAYKNQQCSLNPLYSTDCVGYETAYFNQQCSINSLYSPQCPGYAAAYKTQQCSLNALYATDCPGYAVAYKNQQCAANPLYATDCTGYTQAYHNQQCTLNPLYMSDCAGYQAAYFTQQCNLNGLYDRTCPNYSEAYAKKMVLEQQGIASTVATAGVIASTAPSPTSTTASTTSASTSISSDGAVSVGVSKTGDTNVDKTIAPPPPTANSSAAPAAVVQLAPPPPAPAGPQQAQGEQGRKPEQRAEKRDEPAGDRPARKEDGPGQGPAGSPQMAQAPQGGDSKPAQPTVRDAIAERRQAAARAEAVERGKNVANEMGQLANMESQKQMQNIVIQAMGFTPGFDAYGKAMIQDVAGYKPFTVYNNQRNIENRATLRMFGGTDRLHNEMVDSQYNKEK